MKEQRNQQKTIANIDEFAFLNDVSIPDKKLEYDYYHRDNMSYFKRKKIERQYKKAVEKTVEENYYNAAIKH